MYKVIYIIIILLSLLILYLYLINGKRKECFINISPPFPIDVVYTWAGEHRSSNIRLSYNNELKYSLRSVLKFAPWVNHIFILMNPPLKKPSWFNEQYQQKITILDHYQTFEERHLPCTNSNSIETTMANIPNLSEHFIYMNDDVYLGKPLSYLNFFTSDGKIVIDQEKIRNCVPMQLTNKSKILNFVLPTYCGISRHIPLPNKKSVIQKFNSEYKDYIEWVRNIKSRIGTGTDICTRNNLEKWCQQQHNTVAKYAYDKGEAVTKYFHNNDVVFIFQHFNNENVFLKIKNYPPKFLCINDKEFKNSQEKENIYKGINTFLDSFYSEKTFFEK